MNAAVVGQLEALSQQVARLLTTQSLQKPVARIMTIGEKLAAENQGYGCGFENVNYMGPPRQQWGNNYQPNNRNHQNLSWNYPNAGTYAPSNHPQQQYQAQRAAPPQLVHQDSTIVDLLTKMSEKMDRMESEVTTLMATVDAWAAPPQKIRLEQLANQAPKLPPGTLPANTVTPNEQVKAIITRSGISTMEPPYPSHERSEATKATEKELGETIPVPIVDPSPKDAIGRSEEKQLPKEQCHACVPFPQRLKSEQCYRVEACSMEEDDVQMEQILDELALLDGNKKAQLLGVLQERKAAMRKKPGWIKADLKRSTSSIGQHKVRRAEVKKRMAQCVPKEGGVKVIKRRKRKRRWKVRIDHHKLQGRKRPKAALKKSKPSTPQHATKVKKKAKHGVGESKDPKLESKGMNSGHCVPKLDNLKEIGGEDHFPPPFMEH